MLTIYVIAFVAGGLLVALSALGGGDADAGDVHDAAGHLESGDGHSDALAVHSAGHDGFHAADLWPFLSMRFWTFFLAAGGLTGLLLTWAAELPKLVVAPIAAVVGYGSGVGVTFALRLLKKDDITSTLDERAVVGSEAEVVLPIARGTLGKVRVRVGGQTRDVAATTDEDANFGVSDKAFVFDVREDGTALVTTKPKE